MVWQIPNISGAGSLVAWTEISSLLQYLSAIHSKHQN